MTCDKPKACSRNCGNCDNYEIITICRKDKLPEPMTWDGCFEFAKDGYKPFYDPFRSDLVEMRMIRKEGEK